MTAEQAAELDNDRQALTKCAACTNTDCPLHGLATDKIVAATAGSDQQAA